MPVHDWTRVDAGIYHHFHHGWIDAIARALNRGLLPPNYYALAEQIAGGLGPDVLTLQRPSNGAPAAIEPAGGMDQYAAKAKAVVIRHTSHHRVIAVIELVSPGNKNSRHGLRGFVGKAVELLRAGVHLLVVDLFPPGPRDPQGIHRAIWDELSDSDFTLPADQRLTLAAYIGGPCPEAFVEPTTVGASLPEMPLFLDPDVYVPVPLEATYQAAWEDVPDFWRDVLTAPPGA
ncbi:MAG: DUF4058 family protein [Gemmataceae bacterium]|nr:DUF4058 family protein [Gemmataceae bacterium]